MRINNPYDLIGLKILHIDHYLSSPFEIERKLETLSPKLPQLKNVSGSVNVAIPWYYQDHRN